MSSPTLSILPASESDLPILAEINRLAYFPEAIGQFMFLDWPNETTQHNFFLSRLWANFRNPKAQVLKVAHESGETIAFVCLTLNESARDEGSSVPSKSDAVSSSPPSPINARLAKYVFGEIDRLEGIMKGTAYFGELSGSICENKSSGSAWSTDTSLFHPQSFPCCL